MVSEKVFSKPTWAIVELFGRQVIAGLISEVTISGCDMLRIDVPEVEGIAAYTKFFGNGAIYAITPIDEESALHAVEHLHVRPIKEWTIPARALPPPMPDLGPEDGPGWVEDKRVIF